MRALSPSFRSASANFHEAKRGPERPSSAGDGGAQGFVDTLRRKLANGDSGSEAFVNDAPARKRRDELVAPAITPLPVPLCAAPALPPVGLDYVFLKPSNHDDGAEAGVGRIQQGPIASLAGCPVPAEANAAQPAEARNFEDRAGRRETPPRPNAAESHEDLTPDGAPDGELAFALRVARTPDSPASRETSAPRTGVSNPQRAAPASDPSPAPGTSANPAGPAAPRDEHSDFAPQPRQYPVLMGSPGEAVVAVLESSRTDFPAGSPMQSRTEGHERLALPKVEVKIPPQAAPSETAWKAIERLETLAAARQGSGPASEITWKAEVEGGANVWLRLKRSGEGARAEVTSGDPTLAKVLRGSVDELLASLRRQGFDAEAMLPNSPVSAASQTEQEDSGEKHRGRRETPEKTQAAAAASGPGWMEQWMHVSSGIETIERREEL